MPFFHCQQLASLSVLCVAVVNSVVWIFRGKKQRKNKKERKSPLGRTLHHATTRPFSVSDREHKSRGRMIAARCKERSNYLNQLEIQFNTANIHPPCHHSKHRRQHWRRRVEVIMKIEIWLHGELKQLLSSWLPKKPASEKGTEQSKSNSRVNHRSM